MKKFKTLMLLPAIIAMSLFSFSIVTKAEDSGLKVGGATILEPMMFDFADLYQAKYGKSVHTEGGGANTGFNKMLKGELDIATVTRPLKPEEKTSITCKTIGYDGVVFIVHKNNPINALTKQQVIDIYTGKITNWKELNGINSNIIPPVVRDSGGAMYNMFQKYTGLTDPTLSTPGVNGYVMKNVHLSLTTYDAVEYLISNPNTLSFTTMGGALSFIKDGSPIKIINLDGIITNKENIINKKYPISTELNLAYKSETDKIKKFVDLFSTPEGIKIIEKNNSIPAN